MLTKCRFKVLFYDRIWKLSLCTARFTGVLFLSCEKRKRKIIRTVSVGKFITVLVHERVQEVNVRRLVEFNIVAPDEIHYLIIALGDDFKSHLIGKKQRRVIERLFL